MIHSHQKYVRMEMYNFTYLGNSVWPRGCVCTTKLKEKSFFYKQWSDSEYLLTHWGRATRICVSKLTIIASDNGLSPGRRQAIIWNNAGILSIGLLGTNFSEIWSKFWHFLSRKCAWKCRLRNGGHFVSASMCYDDVLVTKNIRYR